MGKRNNTCSQAYKKEYIKNKKSGWYQANRKEKKKQVTKMNPQKSSIRKEMLQLLVHTTGKSIFFNPHPEKKGQVAR